MKSQYKITYYKQIATIVANSAREALFIATKSKAIGKTSWQWMHEQTAHGPLDIVRILPRKPAGPIQPDLFGGN
jgi:hypothetical protein